MKKIILSAIALIFSVLAINAQENIVVHQGGFQLFNTAVSNVDSIKFANQSSIFNLAGGSFETFALNAIDSITFETEPAGNVIQIIYNGNAAPTVINPYAENGVAITATTTAVSVNSTSTVADLEYWISGSSTGGSLTLKSNQTIVVKLIDLQLTATSTVPPIYINSTVAANIVLSGTSILADAATNGQNAALYSKGDLIFSGNGTLNVTGNAKHAIASKTAMTIGTGNFIVPAAASDALHANGMVIHNGTFNLTATGDGIDADEQSLTINGGSFQINSTVADTKGMKADAGITINGGTIGLTIAGAQSKGISSKADVVINGGNITVTCSGAAVLTASGSGYDPSYCTAIKAVNVTVNDGTLQLAATSTANGGKGISADNNLIINGGNINITTAGNGATYTNASGTTDSYTSSCLTSDANISILGGNITCQSSGTGGKGINADGTLVIGNAGADNSLLTLTVGTSGARFLVSNSSGGGSTPGGGPGGGGFGGGGGQTSADYANPKGIKSTGNLTVNSGVIRVNCTQTTEGGEGMESKAALVVNGGDIEIRSYDDPINGGTSVTFNGGNVYAAARGNDAVDSNGTLTLNGGLVIANGVKGDGEGFDTDRTYPITGGVLLATSGSVMCSPGGGTQKAIRYSAAKAGQNICIKNAANEIILLYTVPIIQGASSGQTLAFIFSDPRLVAGTYTLIYGCTISGGTNYNGYVTGGTYSGGTTKTFTLSGSSVYTTVN